MDYYLYDYDTAFDPLQDELDDNLLFAFGDQLRRARALLKGRTWAEIASALDSLDWMLQEGSWPHFLKSMEEANVEGYSFTNRVKALKAYQDEFDIREQQGFPRATWADYFAVLAIAYVLEALNPANFMDPKKIGQEAYRFQNMDWPLECMEAVCVAECHHELQQYIEAQQTTAKEQGRQGGQKRVAKFEELKALVFEYYEAHELSRRSNRDAAKRIYAALKDEVDAVLTTEDPAHRIAQWIGKYRREQDS